MAQQLSQGLCPSSRVPRVHVHARGSPINKYIYVKRPWRRGAHQPSNAEAALWPHASVPASPTASSTRLGTATARPIPHPETKALWGAGGRGPPPYLQRRTHTIASAHRVLPTADPGNDVSVAADEPLSFSLSLRTARNGARKIFSTDDNSVVGDERGDLDGGARRRKKKKKLHRGAADLRRRA